MIVGEHFVWAHLPKTGGDATARMFDVVAHLVVDRDDLRSQRKHQTIEARVAEGLDLTGRTTMCNIRRLPDWVASSAHHQQRHYGLEPDWDALRMGVVASHAPVARHRMVPPALRPALYRMRRRVERVSADEVLARHVSVPIDRWLRQEHLADDFIDAIGSIAALSPAERAAIRAVPRVNAGGPNDLSARFTTTDLAELYARNPRWAALERRCYGATVIG